MTFPIKSPPSSVVDLIVSETQAKSKSLLWIESRRNASFLSFFLTKELERSIVKRKTAVYIHER